MSDEGRDLDQGAPPDDRPAGRRDTRRQRQQTIVDHVVAHGEASAAELSALTGVSLMTVHRDIAELAGRGILRRYHGGVTAHPSTVFESSSDFRLHANRAAKEALGRAALEFVHPGMSLLLDDSTTALCLARLLPGVGPLTVVSNYRLVAEELRGVDGIRLIGIGGEYSRTHDSFIGLAAEEMIGGFSVDLTVQSTSAIDAEMTYHQEQELVAVKRAMQSAGRVNVLLMDSGKVGRSALHRMAAVETFDHVLLTGPVDAQLLAGMRERTDVRVVDTAPGRQQKLG